jgi:glutamate 5-kinase
LSDVEGVYDRDPRVYGNARIIPVIRDIKEVREAILGESRSAMGTGGIVTKIGAAEKAAAAGIATVITTGLRPGALTQVFDAGRELGTLILPEENRLTHRKHWIAYNLKPAGDIVVDTGAYDALVHKKKSLLPSGLKEVRGSFGAGECVRCLGPDEREFARGLVSYSAQELNRIKGLHTSNIEKVLGYKAYDEVIHRDDLVLL